MSFILPIPSNVNLAFAGVYITNIHQPIRPFIQTNQMTQNQKKPT